VNENLFSLPFVSRLMFALCVYTTNKATIAQKYTNAFISAWYNPNAIKGLAMADSIDPTEIYRVM
jgi:hypothetical protein